MYHDDRHDNLMSFTPEGSFVYDEDTSITEWSVNS
jgi:hypothetical protein